MGDHYEYPSFTRPKDKDLVGFDVAVSKGSVPRAVSFIRLLVAKFLERGYVVETISPPRQREAEASPFTVLSVREEQYGIWLHEICREDRSQPRRPDEHGRKPPVPLVPTGLLRLKIVRYANGYRQHDIDFPEKGKTTLEERLPNIIDKVEADAERWSQIEREKLETRARAQVQEAEKLRELAAEQEQLRASEAHARKVLGELALAGEGRDQSLDVIVRKWPRLPDQVKAAILALVNAIP